jgi:hypothetical protein
MALSTKDTVLRPQASNFSTVLAASPTTYQQTVPTATSVTAAVDAYIASLDALEDAKANGVRSSLLASTKDSLKLDMLNLLRPIYLAVQASKTISDTAKIALGVHIRKVEPTPVPPQALAPQATILSVDGSLVTLRARDAQDPDNRRRPAGTIGLTVCSFIGAEAPADINEWCLQGTTGKTTVQVLFPPTLAPGTKVWLTCFWLSSRKESSPACQPISAVVNYGGTIPTAEAA